MKLLFYQETPMYEALAVHYLSAMAKEAGHSCDVLIESNHKDPYGLIREINPDLIAFSFMTRQHEWAIYKIAQLKEVFDIPILIGGTHPTMYPETLEHCQADYLCIGEGEVPIVELLDRLQESARTDNIPNLHTKIDGEIIKNEIRPLMTSWDEIPLPDRDVYWRYPFLQELPLKRFITSFGCAFRCSFCYINNYREAYAGKGKFFRRKSIDRALLEIKDTQERYPLKRVHFVDDIFSLDRPWLEKFLPRYKSEVNVPFSANIWISHMNESMVRLFKESGCAGLTFGVESGNEKTRKNLIDKNIPDQVYIEHCGYLRKYKIPFHTGNIIGLPGEGIDKAYETARFNRKIGVASARSGLFWPFPNTRLTDYAMEHGMLEADYSSQFINSYSSQFANSVELINKGVYPMVKHKESDKLIIMASLFQAIAKWAWFDRISGIFLKWPRNPIVKALAKWVELTFWFAEAKFFDLLNWDGVKHFFAYRKSFTKYRGHGDSQGGRVKEDMEAQRPLWSFGQKDLAKAYASGRARDGLT